MNNIGKHKGVVMGVGSLLLGRQGSNGYSATSTLGIVMLALQKHYRIAVLLLARKAISTERTTTQEGQGHALESHDCCR